MTEPTSQRPSVTASPFEALAEFVGRKPAVLIVLIVGCGGAGWGTNEWQHRNDSAALEVRAKTAEQLAAKAAHDATSARQECDALGIALKEVTIERDGAREALRSVASGDIATAATRRAEVAESQLREAMLAKDRLERALSAKEVERADWQRRKEVSDQAAASTQAIAIGTLPQCSLRNDVARYEVEKSRLLKEAAELAEPSANASYEVLQLKRNQLLQEVEFKRRLISEIVQRCK